MSIGTLTLCGKRGWDPPSFNRLVLKAFTASNPGAARRGQGLCMTVTCSPLACRGSSVAVSWGSETSRAAAAPRVCSGGGTPHSQTYRPWTTSRVAADHVPGGGGHPTGTTRENVAPGMLTHAEQSVGGAAGPRPVPVRGQGSHSPAASRVFPGGAAIEANPAGGPDPRNAKILGPSFTTTSPSHGAAKRSSRA